MGKRILAMGAAAVLAGLSVTVGTARAEGTDIKIVTVDAVKAGMEALSAGKINFIVECSPLLGEQLFQASSAVLAGQEIPARVVTIETTFNQEQATAALPTRLY